MERPPAHVRQFDRLGRRPTRGYGVGAMRPSRSSPAAPTIASAVALALSVNAATRMGILNLAARRPGQPIERRRDLGTERDGELYVARVDVEPAAARVLTDAVDLDRRRAGSRRDERPAQAQAEHRALLAAKSGFAARRRCVNGFTSAPSFGCTSKWRCGLPFASPESPFHAICWPAVTFAPFGTANVTSLRSRPCCRSAA